jgi:lipoprotein signal peptidase
MRHAGTLAIVIDRFFNGNLIDFIDIRFRIFFWPKFKIADVSMCDGSVLRFFGTMDWHRSREF